MNKELKEAIQRVSNMKDDEINLSEDDHEISDWSFGIRGRFYSKNTKEDKKEDKS